MVKQWISRIGWLHRWMIKYAFEYQSLSKPELFDKMKFAFVDSTGKKYYAHFDKFDLPIARADQLQLIMKAISRRLDEEDLSDWVKATKKIVIGNDKDQAILNTVRMLDALENRMSVAFDEDLLLKLAAITYIDETQDPRIWDEEYEQRKIEQFKKDAKTGLYDFFVRSGLRKYLPSSIDTQVAYQEYSTKADEMKKTFKQMSDDVKDALLRGSDIISQESSIAYSSSKSATR